jgi:LCP family protein required for cell wall assembly
LGKHFAVPEDEAPKRRNSVWARVALIFGLLALGLVSTAAGFAIFEHKNPILAITQVFVPTPQQVFGKPSVLVLVEGLDYDYTDKDMEFSTNSRSDAIWAVNIDFDNKRIYQLSIPRDMIATMPNGAQAKINQAQADGGVKEAKQVVASFLGIPDFDRYVVLRIDATKDIINAIGGLDIVVKSSDCLQYHTGCTGETIDYDDSWGHLHIHFKQGMQHLDGPQAVAYMRFRHDWCSDPCRIKRQQQVLHAMIAKLKGDQVNTLMHAGNLLGIFRRDVQTDFTDQELLSLASYFQGMPDGAIVNGQVPYTSDIDLPVYGDSLVPDVEAKDRLVQAMLVAPPSPEPSPDVMALAAIAPGTLRVDIVNGSGSEGAAHRVALLLKRAGFTIGTVGDASRSDYATTEIHEHSTVTFAGAKVRAALPASTKPAVVVPDPAPTGSPPPAVTSDVTVIVGSDLATATPPASPPARTH